MTAVGPPARRAPFSRGPPSEDCTYVLARHLDSGRTGTARFNHTIIAATSRHASAEFYRHVLEADDAPSWGPFENLRLDGDVLLQFAEPPIEFPPQHYAFLMSEDQFDRALCWIMDSGLEFWADPQRQRPAETNTEHGGRGVYTLDPSGHYIELITQPYM